MLVDDPQFFHSIVAAEHDDASDHVELGDGSDTASSATDVDVPPPPDQGSLLADVNSIDSVATTMATTAGTFKWGPFSFTNVIYQERQGSVSDASPVYLPVSPRGWRSSRNSMFPHSDSDSRASCADDVAAQVMVPPGEIMRPQSIGFEKRAVT